jgi:hypothetical protein
MRFPVGQNEAGFFYRKKFTEPSDSGLFKTYVSNQKSPKINKLNVGYSLISHHYLIFVSSIKKSVYFISLVVFSKLLF